MKFQIIPNEQTPRVDDIENIEIFIIQNIKKLIAFKEYAETHNNAVGLAANQCSIDGNRFMARVFALRDLKTREWKLILDPYITEYIGIKEMKGEGCLTWKDQVIVAERSRAVKVNYYDEIGKKHSEEIYHGFKGQIWQHEINHLNGIEEHVEIFYKEPPPISIGRNDPCPCGALDSNKKRKKYKKCCLLLI